MALTLPNIKLVVSSPTKQFADYDITSDFISEQGIDVMCRRDGLNGVFTEISAPLEFKDKGREFLSELFSKYGIRAEAELSVYTRGKTSNSYSLAANYRLDFTTFSESPTMNRLEIQCMETGFETYLSSNGSTKYDIKVEDLDTTIWQNNRIALLNAVTYEIRSIEDKVLGSTYFPGIYIKDAELLNGDKHEFKEQKSVFGGTYDYFFKAGRMVDLRLDFKFNVYISNFSGKNSILKLNKRSYKQGPNGTEVVDVSLNRWLYIPDSRTNNIDETILLKNLSEGDEISLQVEVNDDINNKFVFSISHFDFFQAGYLESGKTVSIPVAAPEVLFQSIIDKMYGATGKFKCRIEWGLTMAYRVVLCAAESIRRFPEPRFHTSAKDFIDWMNVLGYGYEITDSEIVFKPRANFFRRTGTALDLSEKETGHFYTTAVESWAYTGVKIGWPKQDIENINSVYEANGLFEYTTGFQSRSENILDLSSPYRADSIGIEALLINTADNTKDDKADNDIFCVALNKNNNTEYTAIKIIDRITEITMFNAPFNPYFLVDANASLIGISATELKFAGTDMSSTAELSTGVDVYGDRKISGKLFEPINYRVYVGSNQELPKGDALNGLVKFKIKGKTFQGYIQEITKNLTRNANSSWTLRAVK